MAVDSVGVGQIPTEAGVPLLAQARRYAAPGVPGQLAIEERGAGRVRSGFWRAAAGQNAPNSSRG